MPRILIYMLKKLLLFSFVCIPSFLVVPTNKRCELVSSSVRSSEDISQQFFDEMELDGKVSFTAFQKAFEGYHKISTKHKNILTLIDFSQPSTAKRLFVFDLNQKRLLFSSVVSHGKNSGTNYATLFSNKVGSYQSSLGFYLTEQTYQGKNGYSLILNGLEKGFNDRAKQRAIVMHGASYANPSVANRTGRLGRSFGCPAIPEKLVHPIIDAIKEGSVLFIYANNENYLANSPLTQSGHTPSF